MSHFAVIGLSGFSCTPRLSHPAAFRHLRQVLLGGSVQKAVVIGNVFAGTKRITVHNSSMRLSIGLNVFDDDEDLGAAGAVSVSIGIVAVILIMLAVVAAFAHHHSRTRHAEIGRGGVSTINSLKSPLTA